MTTNIEQTRAKIKQMGLVAILRGDFPMPNIMKIAEGLLEAGVPLMEVTLNSQGALEAIKTLRREFGGRGLFVGAGTVRTAEQVEAAIAAGAEFIVSPNFDPAAVARSQAHDILHLPGVFTPSEAHNAFAAGCRMVKLFPVDALGPGYLKALRAPLNDIEFVPTGGIDANNLGSYIRAGAVAVGIGSSLISGPNQSTEEIVARAKALRAAWEQARHG
jgi:2-dehydro-3-deoxyphosphogluconate aldolase/(4S)-4-hydroxy-2-oxoglutarate aldolase